jgi:hypothetical protein
MSGPASRNRDSVSSASIGRSVSNPCRLQFDGARLSFYAYCTFSGSSSGTTSEYPVSRATGKIARREFARCAAIVSKSDVQERKTTRQGNIRDIAPQSFAYPHVCGVSQWRFSVDRCRTDLQLRHQCFERMQELASGTVRRFLLVERFFDRIK